MKTITMCIAILMAVMLLSCSEGSNSVSKEKSVSVQDLELADVSKPEDQNKSGFISSMDSTASVDPSGKPLSPVILQAGGPAPVIDWDKKIIKTADITLELKDYKNYNSDIHKSLRSYGAYVSAEEQNESEERITNSITIKVPVDRFEELVNSLPAEGVKILEKKITSDDVTGEVVDTRSRIEAKKQVRARYLDLLKQAKNMEEILQVQGEINSIHEDLEAATGRVNHLVHQSAMSTIHLTYYQFLNGTTERDVQPNLFSKLVQAFKDGGSIVSGLLVFLVTMWPLFLAVMFGWLLLKKWKLSSLKT